MEGVLIIAQLPYIYSYRIFSSTAAQVLTGTVQDISHSCYTSAITAIQLRVTAPTLSTAIQIRFSEVSQSTKYSANMTQPIIKDYIYIYIAYARLLYIFII